MYKACGRCGKIHKAGYICTVGRTYTGGQERELRSSYKWSKKSQEIRERANYLCEVCRKQNIFTYENVEVHHIEKLRDRSDLFLDDLNLVCLCTEHHKQADAGEISKDYLRELAREREGYGIYPPHGSGG